MAAPAECYLLHVRQQDAHDGEHVQRHIVPVVQVRRYNVPGKIPTQEWVPFITSRFSATGKTITEKQAERICDITDNLSSYVQQMAWVIWYKANPVVSDMMIDDAVADLLEQNKVFFQRDVESLTELQLNFLIALADGVETGLTRNEVIRKYHLQTSANVQGIEKVLDVQGVY